ncbi:hypothetical protein QYM36_014216 [Artemia franciscana]|uniref:Uncharacterized protein n=1 Tax=Artemia franciscana TaxID=6661 RepID=A0AA88HK48_ARTSF|nr:hypothetical protein QYM36_014216 [Artemia franciscana]
MDYIKPGIYVLLRRKNLVKVIKIEEKKGNIGQNIGREEQKSNPDVDLRICKTLHSALSKEFVEVMIEYHKALTDYIERFKAPIPLQLESSKN